MTHQKIKNPLYRDFLDNGNFETFVNIRHIKQAIDNIYMHEPKNKEYWASSLIVLFYTGARPVEMLQLRAKDFELKDGYVTIQLKTAKRGVPRKLFFKKSSPYIMRLYNFARKFFDDQFIFYPLQSSYKRQIQTKDGIKERADISNKYGYHFRMWFENVFNGSITPYFLRHNRMSSLAEQGADMQGLRFWKGARTYDSVMPYLHFSSRVAKQMSDHVNIK